MVLIPDGVIVGSDNIYSVMGVYAVTIIIMLGFFKWLAEQLKTKDAIIAKKDELLAQMLPALSEANKTMAQVTQAASDLVQAAAVVRDRRRGEATPD